MDRIQEIDALATKLYEQLHEAVNYYVDECEGMMMRHEPYADIDSIVSKIAELRVERAYLLAVNS